MRLGYVGTIWMLAWMVGCASDDPLLRMLKGTSTVQSVSNLRNSDPDVRHKAVVALGDSQTRDPQVVRILCAVLEEDKDPLVRAASAEALGKIGNPAAIPALIKALGDERYMVRWDAVKALAKMKAEVAIPNLERLAKTDRHSDVRLEAVNSLGKIGGKEAIGPLIELLADKDENIAYFASQNLARLTGQSFGLHQAKWTQWWEENKSKPLPPPVGSQTPTSWWARWRGPTTQESAPQTSQPEADSEKKEKTSEVPTATSAPPAKRSGGWFSGLFRRPAPSEQTKPDSQSPSAAQKPAP